MLTVNKENYFDVAEALHVWLSLNHAGQFSMEYMILGLLDFNPGLNWTEQSVIDGNEFYPMITKDNYLDAFNSIKAITESE